MPLKLNIRNCFNKYFLILFFYLILRKFKSLFNKKKFTNNYDKLYSKKSISLKKFLKNQKINLSKNSYQKKIKDFDRQIKHYFITINKFKKKSNLAKNHGGPGNIILIDILTELPRVQSVLETGVGLGYSTSTILSNLSKKKGSLTSVDIPYLNVKNLNYLGYIIKKSLKKKMEFNIRNRLLSFKDASNPKKKI